MSGSLRILRAEAYRTLRSPAIWVAFLALSLLSAGRVFIGYLFEAAKHARMIANGRDALPLDGEGSAWAPFVNGWSTGLALASLLLLMHGAYSFAADHQSGLLRIPATRSASRWSLILGRAGLIPFYVLGAIAATGFSSWLAARGVYAFGDVVLDGLPWLTQEEMQAEVLGAVWSTVPGLVAAYTFGFLFSALLRSGIWAVSVSLTIFLMFDFVKDFFGDARYWCFATFTPSLADSSAMSEMVGIAQGYSDAGYSDAVARMNLWIPWPQALLFLILTGLITSRRAL